MRGLARLDSDDQVVGLTVTYYDMLKGEFCVLWGMGVPPV